jgi:hypothetical protein
MGTKSTPSALYDSISSSSQCIISPPDAHYSRFVKLFFIHPSPIVRGADRAKIKNRPSSSLKLPASSSKQVLSKKEKQKIIESDFETDGDGEVQGLGSLPDPRARF